MTSREYIESGTLEAYALGMLSAEEAAEVEQRASSDPEVKTALREAQQSLEKLADSYTTTPRPEWKQDILAAAKAGAGAKASTASTEDKIPAIGQKTAAPQQWGKALAIAAAVLLLISLGINVLQYRNLSNLQASLDSALFRIANLEQENESFVTNYRQLQQDLQVLRDPATATFNMKSVEGREPGYLANVLWNSQTESVYLDVVSLPEAPAGKQYQLWALKDGKPIDMGVFDVVNEKVALQQMGRIDGADAFAVTLEPKGGSAQPTLEEMYVYGAPGSAT